MNNVSAMRVPAAERRHRGGAVRTLVHAILEPTEQPRGREGERLVRVVAAGAELPVDK